MEDGCLTKLTCHNRILLATLQGECKTFRIFDWHFCLNTGILFLSPEEYFLNEAPEVRSTRARRHNFDPTWSLTPDSTMKGRLSFVHNSVSELIITDRLALANEVNDRTL
jgi:hypothetical protein